MVDGNAGDGTVQGTCPYSYMRCQADGTCRGILCQSIIHITFSVGYNYLKRFVEPFDTSLLIFKYVTVIIDCASDGECPSDKPYCNDGTCEGNK